MTLLVLGLAVPAVTIRSESDCVGASRRARTQRPRLHDELHDAGDLLGRPGDATRSACQERPQLRLDSACLSLRRDARALLDRLAGALSDLQGGTARVLAQHRAPRVRAARRPAVRSPRAPL